MNACVRYPYKTQFFHVAGAVEHIRQNNLALTCVPVDCGHCPGWHVLPRPKVTKEAA